jgi:photosynthetic reaction center M subunit
MSERPPDPVPPPESDPVTRGGTPRTVETEQRAAGALAAADAQAGDVIPFSLVEEFYKRPGGTMFAQVFGSDPLDFWIGRFYVGFWGLVSVTFAALGAIFYFYQFIVVEGTYNILQARIDPPPLSVGLRLQAPGQPGFNWQIIVICATIAFIAWGLREIDICRKLRMGIEVPLCFFAVVSSWITLQWLRPLLMGSWGNGFPLGITHHLDWVSNIGYQYFNFFYNPFHAIGISLLFFSTMLLSMHGSAIRMIMNRPKATVHNIDVFWRGITTGYSIGEIGIHRIAFWFAAAAVLVANLCILLSGTLVWDWNAFWRFWDRLPWWSIAGATTGLIGAAVVTRGTRPEPEVDLNALEEGRAGLATSFGINKRAYIGWMDRLFGSGTIGPFYLGLWGAIALGAFSTTVFIILISYITSPEVNYNFILFLREFPNLSVNPPPPKYGLGIAPWYEGGNWQVATFFLHLSVLAWWVRIYTRARETGVGANLARAFAAALFLYFTIYLIRPLLLGSWAEAPGHGLRAQLDWTNNVSIRYGNFYYNPFHMLSIFFLLGSTMLLGMHGATIVATSPYGAELEAKEMQIEGPGTHRAQLFWRWTMGFNANAASIHYWAWWFAVLCVITGAIGLLLSGTVIHDWYAWAEKAHIVAPLDPKADWSQFLQTPVR